MTLQIIGAGFGRTGTDSMRQALQMLGFGPCYHMYEVLPSPERTEQWKAISKGAAANWDQVFDGYRATVDWPAAFFWRELAEHYPHAKILLTLRDADSWFASMEKTILTVLRERKIDTIGHELVTRRVFGGELHDRDHIIAAYKRNTAEVQAAFGPDRLLTYNIGDGWEPLCDFLGVEVPSEPYPHANQPGSFHANVTRLAAAREVKSD